MGSASLGNNTVYDLTLQARETGKDYMNRYRDSNRASRPGNGMYTYDQTY
uniref:Uncharacterized protein n=2 Tax=Picea TaxID=3328 RepID=A0A101LW22_PICGL|nr:hypothetical protein ABT39_MTgene1489 [Picea glauca]QHR92662.1 hypothetical protein Q903MT_gene6710 [Picea sitchensis]